jgi:hypothetical protein
MSTQAERVQSHKGESVANNQGQHQTTTKSAVQFVDNRAEAVAQRQLKNMMDNSPQTKQIAQLQALAYRHAEQKPSLQRKQGNNKRTFGGLESGIKNYQPLVDSVSERAVVQREWIRIPTDPEAQESAEMKSIVQMATSGDFLNAFRMHITTEPAIATKFHELTLRLMGNENLMDIVNETLQQTYADGHFNSAQILPMISAKLPLDQTTSAEAFSANLSDSGVSDATSGDKVIALNLLITNKFEALGIPPPEVLVLGSMGERSGEFNSTSWSFSISSDKLDKPMSEWGATAYHEARHAEQFFMIARLINQEALDRPNFNQIPEDVFNKADRQPPLKGAELKKATMFYNSIFGGQAAARNSTLRMLGDYTPAKIAETHTVFQANLQDCQAKYKTCKDYADSHKQTAQTNGQAWPDERQAENKKILLLARDITELSRLRFIDTVQKQKSSFAAYLNLPEEKEAHELGDKVRALLEDA